MCDLPVIVQQRLPIPELLEFCRRNPIQEMWIFGSVLDDWKPESDVDLLVRFLPEARVDYFGMEDELQAIVGRQVDLIEADSVTNPFVRMHIREHRVKLYAS